MDQIAQIAGAILILIAFTAAQRGSMSPHSLVYLVLNFVGSLVLAAVALSGENWGFLMLEGVWAVVSAWGLVGALRGRPPAAAH
ncbi:MAG TPA: hypothetical protein VIM03_03485 [Thermoleophilaceae bacterium]|jgi:hypothetical protein